jgi:hypothetical protein
VMMGYEGGEVKLEVRSIFFFFFLPSANSCY